MQKVLGIDAPDLFKLSQLSAAIEPAEKQRLDPLGHELR